MERHRDRVINLARRLRAVVGRSDTSQGDQSGDRQAQENQTSMDRSTKPIDRTTLAQSEKK